MTNLSWLTDLLAHGTRHFLLSGLMGALAFCLTQTILCACGWVWERGTRRKVNSVVAYGILFTAILAGLACALLAHWALDYYSAWFSAPLGPPLQIDIGPNL